MIKHAFKSSGFIQGDTIINMEGDHIDLSKLPPFLRTLMVTDGTVTKSLEAYFWEPVKVKSDLHQIIEHSEVATMIEHTNGDRVLHRQVSLCGANTNRIYACADSYINLSKLPTETAERLSENTIGIGELLRDEGLETYREIIDVGFTQEQENQLAYRRYVIKVAGITAIEIKEQFPINVYVS